MILSPKRFLAVAFGGLLCAQTAVADTFDDLRARAVTQLTGGALNPNDSDLAPSIKRISDQAATWANSIITTAGRTSVWPDITLSSSDPSTFGVSLDRLQAISVAWKTPGTAQYGDAALGTKLVSAMQLIHDRGFNNLARETGNWWFWEIGGSRGLMTNCMLLWDVMSAEQRARHVATVERWCPNPDNRVAQTLKETGANRADKATIVAYHGIVSRNESKLAMARDGLSDKSGNGANSVFKYVTSGDGFYRDGSFVQHGYIPYTGTYGVVLLGNVASLFSLLSGTTWAITDSAATLMYDSVASTFSPVTKDGLMMDTVRGRAVSRQASTDRNSGQDTIAAIIELANGAPASYAPKFKSLAKGWLQRGNPATFYSQVSPARAAAAKALLSNSGVTADPQLTGSYVFPNMDRVVHRRPGWSFAISMNSKRIAPVEWGNGENMRGWYQGDGMTYLYNSDLDQFNDAFWPTVDSYRLPGITVDTRSRADLTGGMSYARSVQGWVGGAALENRYSAVGFHYGPSDISLRAKKSWFLFDDVVVALGVDINSNDGRGIETVVENRNLHQGDDALTTQAGWAHLDGTAGYVFLAGTKYQSKKETRTGTWRSINSGGDTAGDDTTRSNKFATIWVDHGVSPANASYAYVVLPGASASSTSSWASAPPVTVLANTATVQAVRLGTGANGIDGITMLNFWSAGSVAGYTSSGPASVVIRREGGAISLAVSDPTRTTSSVTLTLPYAIKSVQSADAAVTVTPGLNAKVTVNTAGTAGAAKSAVLVAS